jgi:hypothetical protein
MIPSFRFERLLNAIRHPVTEYQVSRAKAAHRAAHPPCAVCLCPRDPVTGKQNDVHHVVPVHVDPERAADPTNLVTLCRLHHFLVGHLRSWKLHNPNVNVHIGYLCDLYANIVRNGYKSENPYEERIPQTMTTDAPSLSDFFEKAHVKMLEAAGASADIYDRLAAGETGIQVPTWTPKQRDEFSKWFLVEIRSSLNLSERDAKNELNWYLDTWGWDIADL